MSMAKYLLQKINSPPNRHPINLSVFHAVSCFHIPISLQSRGENPTPCGTPVSSSSIKTLPIQGIPLSNVFHVISAIAKGKKSELDLPECVLRMVMGQKFWLVFFLLGWFGLVFFGLVCFVFLSLS